MQLQRLIHHSLTVADRTCLNIYLIKKVYMKMCQLCMDVVYKDKA